jgi:FkbM family methyltransferase
MTLREQSDCIAALIRRGYDFSVVHDIGANIGEWTEAVCQVLPRAQFELFEPLAGRVAEVDAGSRFAGLPNVRLHAVALSDHTGPGEIKVLGDAGVGSSILVLDADRRKKLTIIPCECWRLDDLVAARGLPQPDFLKLDTQAAELKVLSGAVETLKAVKFVLLETWMRRVYGPETPLFHEIAAWLYAHDFVLYEILSLDEGRDADGTLRWFDAVFINKAVSSFPKWAL